MQLQLRTFKTELADVTIYADMQVKIDGFLKFADCFFDGVFADWAVMDKISNAKKQVEQTKGQIRFTLEQLEAMMDRACKEQERLRGRLDELVVEAV